ncbi:hypothetical protein AB0M39_17075 [Streptomyces sp. NPDC051907]|uniref:hypothetical protein n=1 Tax=Streptomyces sp. NPDC051907 TaxID=3155284 RepID=UPI00342A8B5F
MHADIHLSLHAARSAELQADAERSAVAPTSPPTDSLRTQLGWKMVELGLHLVQQQKQPARTVLAI